MNASASIRLRAKGAAVGAAVVVVTLTVTTSVVAATHESHTAKADAGNLITMRMHEVIKPKLYDVAKPAGPSIGDEIIEKEILYVNDKRIGYDLLHFTAAAVTRTGPDVVLQGVLVLKGGTTNLLGETTFQKIRVAGGTGT